MEIYQRHGAGSDGFILMLNLNNAFQITDREICEYAKLYKNPEKQFGVLQIDPRDNNLPEITADMIERLLEIRHLKSCNLCGEEISATGYSKFSAFLHEIIDDINKEEGYMDSINACVSQMLSKLAGSIDNYENELKIVREKRKFQEDARDSFQALYEVNGARMESLMDKNLEDRNSSDGTLKNMLIFLLSQAS